MYLADVARLGVDVLDARCSQRVAKTYGTAS